MNETTRNLLEKARKWASFYTNPIHSLIPQLSDNTLIKIYLLASRGTFIMLHYQPVQFIVAHCMAPIYKNSLGKDGISVVNSSTTGRILKTLEKLNMVERKTLTDIAVKRLGRNYFHTMNEQLWRWTPLGFRWAVRAFIIDLELDAIDWTRAPYPDRAVEKQIIAKGYKFRDEDMFEILLEQLKSKEPLHPAEY